MNEMNEMFRAKFDFIDICNERTYIFQMQNETANGNETFPK